MDKTADAFRTISEVATELDLPQHVLRFWETRFTQIRPLKRGGGRRYYRREDVDLLRAIRQLLYGDGYTIKGVQKILKEQGARGVLTAWRDGSMSPLRADETADAALPSLPPIDDLQIPYDMDGDDLTLTVRDDEQAISFVPSSSRRILDAQHYDALKALLSEINECERLLGNVRRFANA